MVVSRREQQLFSMALLISCSFQVTCKTFRNVSRTTAHEIAHRCQNALKSLIKFAKKIASIYDLPKIELNLLPSLNFI